MCCKQLAYVTLAL